MLPEKFEQVSVIAKANIYFEGGVVSHSFENAEGEKKTLGIIKPGAYNFGTGAPEQMDIIDGNCLVKVAGESEFKEYGKGDTFHIPGDSSFDIEVKDGFCQYLCSFLKA